jgi:RNA polymerase sigma-70 factor (ECF subfamily)
VTETRHPDLVARIRAGDREAIADVVKTYLPQILRAARSSGLGQQRADEVTQETFKTFVESAHRFEGRSHVRTWLFGILYRKIAEERRDLARAQRNDPIDETFDDRFDAKGRWRDAPRRPDVELESKETLRQIEECLEQAPVRQRMAFLLREVEGLSTTEICKIVGVTVTNLGVMLHRARNRLRECLETKGVL